LERLLFTPPFLEKFAVNFYSSLEKKRCSLNLKKGRIQILFDIEKIKFTN